VTSAASGQVTKEIADMIYDCFTFFNELDLLELRLEELGEVVDRFVLVESTKTFSNKPKELYFEKNRARFAKYLDKIVHIIVEDNPEHPKDAWEYEFFQRNAIARGLTGCDPDDIIIISDIDEIPRASVVREFAGEFALLDLDFYYYRLNCKCASFGTQVSAILRFRHLTTPQEIRNTWYSPARSSTPIIPNAGWHFSYLGDTDRIILKIESFAEQQLNIPQFKDKSKLEKKIEEGLDLFDRPDHAWKYVAVDNTFPTYVLNNLERFRPYIGMQINAHISGA
jgi:beta-1,4-mannosyl-glycoprotein beta-1,4-N-acetylglucosaminyltransferase